MISPELKARVREYLSGQADLETLEAWLAQRLPLFVREPNSLDAQLADKFERGLAEMDDELIDEDEFKRSLQQEIAKEGFFFCVDRVPPTIRASSTSSEQTVNLVLAPAMRLA